VGDHPLRPPTDRRLGRPLPHQLANQTQAPPIAPGKPSFTLARLCGISSSFLELSPSIGQIPTCYSPVRHLPPICIATYCAAVRLACVKHTASVQSEPGSNSPLYTSKLTNLISVTLYCHFLRNFTQSHFYIVIYYFLLLVINKTKVPTFIAWLSFLKSVTH
jgi:hypothetical protein